MNLGGPLQKFVIYAMSLSSPQIDFEYWDRLISEAVEEPDPAISNFKITRCHYLLSMALQQLLGPDAGANFHSWAVWGSRKAGVTIRQEDLEEARRDGTVVGGIVGGIVGLGLGWFLIAWLTWGAVPAVELFGAGDAGGDILEADRQQQPDHPRVEAELREQIFQPQRGADCVDIARTIR